MIQEAPNSAHECSSNTVFRLSVPSSEGEVIPSLAQPGNHINRKHGSKRTSETAFVGLYMQQVKETEMGSLQLNTREQQKKARRRRGDTVSYSPEICKWKSALMSSMDLTPKKTCLELLCKYSLRTHSAAVDNLQAIHTWQMLFDTGKYLRLVMAGPTQSNTLIHPVIFCFGSQAALVLPLPSCPELFHI